MLNPKVVLFKTTALGQVDTCASTSSALLEHYFNGTHIPLTPGTPCRDRMGYCDKFHVCRLVDEDGPIARVKNSILDFIELQDISDWMKVSSCMRFFSPLISSLPQSD